VPTVDKRRTKKTKKVSLEQLRKEASGSGKHAGFFAAVAKERALGRLLRKLKPGA